MDIIKSFSQFDKILSSRNKKQIIFAIILSVITGLFDLIGIASILPVLSVLTNPSLLNTNENLNFFYEYSGLRENEFIILLGLISLFLIIFNQILRVFCNWYILFIAEGLLYEKSRDLFLYYLLRPYKYFLKSSTHHLVQKCTNYVHTSIGNYFTSFLIMISQTITFFFILGFLFFYEPFITLFLVISIGLFYFIVFNNLKGKISQTGKVLPFFFKETSKIISNTFNSYKEFKLSNNKNYFFKLFDLPAKKYKEGNIFINLLQQLPVFAIEVFAYVSILFLSLYLYFNTDNFNQTIPLIGLIALSLRRLLPAAQTIYLQLTQIKFFKKSFEVISSDLINSLEFSERNKKKNKSKLFDFNRTIEFKKIKFSYNKSNVLKNLDIKIHKGKFIGITGLSGQGKTTFLDLLCGLLKPKSGEIYIDNNLINKIDSDNWGSQISYVPQKANLLDQTVLKNVTFDDGKVNLRKVKKVCKIVEISSFIEKKLKNKYYTKIGEEGVRLSGGQAQRINLARALYNQPKILILDEATNSIDSIIENKIINKIKKNYKNLTVIFVSHRIKILEKMDKIFFFNEGNISSQGPFSFVKKNSKLFQRIIKLNSSKTN
ncbi:MAG: hypothetical protein CBC82_07150 [Cellvibrionales bacterium TMED122]|nr:MAG: hypothetical protein CBC82_07150 [Cellvibrionales bacterium TMED122]|tara:strand:+ start:4940 stop:6745 length:1806 start_codon:yes stop_codon:yes gene_type:complete